VTTKRYRNVVFSCTNSTADKFDSHCALYMSNKSEIGRELISAYMSAPENMPPSERVKRVLNAFKEGNVNE
jgi:hypothetical protein